MGEPEELSANKDEKDPPPPEDTGNTTVDFRGEQRSNQTHESRTDRDAKLARKSAGKEAKLSYSGNLLVENRNGLIVNTEVFEAKGDGRAGRGVGDVGADSGRKAGDGGRRQGLRHVDFVAECRNLQVTPHVAQNKQRRERD